MTRSSASAGDDDRAAWLNNTVNTPPAFTQSGATLTITLPDMNPATWCRCSH